MHGVTQFSFDPDPLYEIFLATSGDDCLNGLVVLEVLSPFTSIQNVRLANDLAIQCQWLQIERKTKLDDSILTTSIGLIFQAAKVLQCSAILESTARRQLPVLQGHWGLKYDVIFPSLHLVGRRHLKKELKGKKRSP